METLELYVVRSKDGKYLRAKGYNGYGDSWVTELKRAKVYTKKGGASGQITWWATNYPDYGVPELVPLVATIGEPIDQTERVTKVKEKKLKQKIENEIFRAKTELDKSVRELERKTTRFFKDQVVKAQSKLADLEQKLDEHLKK